MTFNSWAYLLLALVVVPLHWLLPHRFRTLFLVCVNLAVYSLWRWEFTFLLLFSTAVDFICAKAVNRTENQTIRRLWLLGTLVVNLGLLAYFKYTYFLVDNVGAAAGLLGFAPFSHDSLALSIILPLGISFYTFHSISYTIDVYRRQIQPIGSYLEFLTFVTFWPQLVAGPILRAAEVVPQLVAERRLNWAMVSTGLGLIVVGLFKKVAIADNVAPFVDVWFAQDPHLLTALDVWNAAFLFGFQIYFDFSGYSDIAIGSALLLGIVFPENFNWPYMATSPRDFWQRWHISLSSWIRDYLYLPLTGQKFKARSAGGVSQSTGGISVAVQAQADASKTRALFLTWAIMGLWHGAAWTFVLWGLYHSAIIWLYRFIKPLNRVVERYPLAGWLLTLPVAMAGWIFFRARDVTQALIMFGKLLNPFEYYWSPDLVGLSNPVAGWSYLYGALILGGMVTVYLLQNSARVKSLPAWFTESVRTCYLAVMFFAVVLLMQQTTQFIYFQF